MGRYHNHFRPKLARTGKRIFDKVSSQVISSNGQQIRCVVPYFNTNPTVSVTVIYGADTVKLNNYATLNAPVITSFTPTQALGDTVIINGDHFENTGLLVTFGSVQSTVIYGSKKMLKVIVPDGIQSTHTTISVKSQLQTVAATSNFVLLEPVITSITPSAFIGNVVTIKGKYFHPLGPFQLLLDNKPANFEIQDDGTITFKVPYQAYPRRKTTITLKLLDYTITYPVDLIIKDNWVLVKQGIPFEPYNATPLAVGSDVYVIAPIISPSNNQFYLWHFNPADFSWTAVGTQLSFTNGNICTGTCGNKIYLYNITGPDTFYEFDPATSNWTAKAGFIGPPRYNPIMFSISGNLYLGSGQHVVNGQIQSVADWYMYTPGNDQWSRVADMLAGFNSSYPMTSAQAVVINNIAYVVCGGWFFDYKYDPANNTWSPMQNMLEPRVNAGVVVYNQKLYTLEGTVVQNVGNPNRNLFKYDPVADQWQYLPFSMDPYGAELNIAFTTGGKIYMVSYDTYGSINNLYEGLSLP
ncbi:N-acetylneuraminate epimerase [Mucilaginibacter gotjawali]|uniref:N-acetylneuraminate epimerase n=1 Tax=Mucilaginibacter gotjawali TaxID=1550579 RepID=A0A110B0M4_9SPHI|nr:IPT/TIG domain-containing protein [Mucilaginibacter gotjawali]BAU52552.1 N-acetylneuraminate epimerase [Mucilaginibacter gotjawali]